MIRHMRHGSPPRLMALQSILSPNRRESLPTPSAGVRMIAAARPEISDAHAGLEAERPNDLAGFINGIALLLGRPDWADDLCDRTIRLRKGARRDAGRPQRADAVCPRLGGQSEEERESQRTSG